MHKIGRWILLALFVAFLAGLMPTIFEWCDRFFVFTEEGLGVTRHFTHTVDSVFLTLKDYAWHITIIYAAVIAFVIFMEGQNPDRTILWMLALIFLPVFGISGPLAEVGRFVSITQVAEHGVGLQPLLVGLEELVEGFGSQHFLAFLGIQQNRNQIVAIRRIFYERIHHFY